MLKSFFKKLPKDEIVSFIAMGLRMGVNILILPVILRKIPSNELAIWYVFLSLSTISSIFDMGLSATIVRFSAAFWGGADEIKSNGLGYSTNVTPNLEKLSQLYSVSRKIYCITGTFLGIVLAGLSPIFIFSSENTMTEQNTWAWWLFVLSISFSLFASMGSNMLRGTGKIVLSQKIAIWGCFLQIVVTSFLIFQEFGLLSMVIGGIGNNILIYFLSYRALKKIGISFNVHGDVSLFMAMIPISIKTAAIGIGVFFIYNSNILLASKYLEPEMTASFGLTVQLVSVFSSLGCIFISVKVPFFTRAFQIGDFGGIKRVFMRAYTCAILFFLAGGVSMLFFAPMFLDWIGSRTKLLPIGFFAFFLLHRFFDFNHGQYFMLVSAENKMPFVWHSLGAGLLVVMVGSITVEKFGLWGLLGTTMCVQLLINNWYPVVLGLRILKRKSAGALVAV